MKGNCKNAQNAIWLVDFTYLPLVYCQMCILTAFSCFKIRVKAPWYDTKSMVPCKFIFHHQRDLLFIWQCELSCFLTFLTHATNSTAVKIKCLSVVYFVQ